MKIHNDHRVYGIDWRLVSGKFLLGIGASESKVSMERDHFRLNFVWLFTDLPLGLQFILLFLSDLMNSMTRVVALLSKTIRSRASLQTIRSHWASKHWGIVEHPSGKRSLLSFIDITESSNIGVRMSKRKGETFHDDDLIEITKQQWMSARWKQQSFSLLKLNGPKG